VDERVSELQQSLCRAAKADKSRRFHTLYDKVYRENLLMEAWNRPDSLRECRDVRIERA